MYRKENGQDVPDWLKQMSSYGGRSSGGGGRRGRGKGGFGSRDYRKDSRGGGKLKQPTVCVELCERALLFI